MKFLTKLHYNSPVILSIALISLISLILGEITNMWTTTKFFTVYNSSFTDPLSYIRIFGHIFGHADYNHFAGNMLLFLVIGPPMEEKYGSTTLLIGILATAVISGLLHIVFFPGTGLLGASGIVFMLILMSSLAGMQSGSIPITFVLVALLYLGDELYSAIFVSDNVSQFVHIIGGCMGTIFGYKFQKKKEII